MIPRRKLPVLKDALSRQAAVALIGPRQVGKTTLALELSEDVASLYLDLSAATWYRTQGYFLEAAFSRSVRISATTAGLTTPPRAAGAGAGVAAD
jgi:hypothetical protein